MLGLYLGMQHLAPRSNEGHHNNPKVLTPRLQARGALPDNLFNPYAEKIVKELGAAVEGAAQRQCHHANAGGMSMIGRLGADLNIAIPKWAIGLQVVVAFSWVDVAGALKGKTRAA